MKRAIGVLALLCLFSVLLCGCSRYEKGDQTLIATVGGVEIRGETYDYIFRKNLEQFFGAEKSENDLSENEKKKLNDAVEWEMQRYAAVEIAAEFYGVSLSEDDEKLIEAKIDEIKSGFESEADYLKELESRYMSENVLYLQTKNLVLDDKLNSYLYPDLSKTLTEEKLDDDVGRYCYAAVQILWTGDRAEEQIGKIAEKIKTVEEFYEYMRKYSLDTVKDVRICILGEMLEEFEEAALALQPGEISDVVLSPVGAHLILRVELTKDMIDAHRSQLREKDLARLYRNIMTETARKAEIVYESGKSEKSEKS